MKKIILACLFLASNAFAYSLSDIKYIFWNQYTRQPDAYVDNVSSSNALGGHTSSYYAIKSDVSSSTTTLYNQINSTYSYITSNYVSLAGTETITGQKVFTNNITVGSSATVNGNVYIKDNLWIGNRNTYPFEVQSATSTIARFTYTGANANDDLSDTMTANTTPVPSVISASAEVFPAWQGFDKATNTRWIGTASFPQFLKYDFGSGNGKAITYYTIVGVTPTGDAPDATLKSWTMQGSNDNTNWVIVDTQTLISFSNGERKTFTLSPVNTTSYRYYKLNITANNGSASYTQLSELTLNVDYTELMKVTQYYTGFGAKTTDYMFIFNNGYWQAGSNSQTGYGYMKCKKNLQLEVFGDSYAGGYKLHLKNGTGAVAGAQIEAQTGAFDIADLNFKAITTNQYIRYQGVGSQFEFGDAGNPELIISQTQTQIRRGILSALTTTYTGSLVVSTNAVVTRNLTVGNAIYITTTSQNAVIRSTTSAINNVTGIFISTNVTITDRLHLGQIYHVVGGTFSITTTIPCTQNVWSKLTNATGNLFQGTEVDGFTMVTDSMVVVNKGDYFGVSKVSYSANTGNDWSFRIRDVTTGAVTMQDEGTSTTGDTNTVTNTMPFYLEANANDIYVLEVMNTSTNDDIIIHSTKFFAIYLHD